MPRQQFDTTFPVNLILSFVIRIGDTCFEGDRGLDRAGRQRVESAGTLIHSFKRTLRGLQGAAMKHFETNPCSPELDSGRFFCPLTGPLTLPSPLWGEGELSL